MLIKDFLFSLVCEKGAIIFLVVLFSQLMSVVINIQRINNT